MRPVKARRRRGEPSRSPAMRCYAIRCDTGYSFGGGKAFVDFQNDVTSRDLRWQLRKGSTRSSMSSATPPPAWRPTRARHRTSTRWASCRRRCELPIPQVGHTTFRMPYTPVTFGALAGTARGALFEPVRRTPIHHWAVSQGAVFEDVGLEARPLFPARPRKHARCRCARMPSRTQCCRHLRCHHARQDRSGRPGRRGVPQPHLHQQLRRDWPPEAAAMAFC